MTTRIRRHARAFPGVKHDNACQWLAFRVERQEVCQIAVSSCHRFELSQFCATAMPVASISSRRGRERRTGRRSHRTRDAAPVRRRWTPGESTRAGRRISSRPSVPFQQRLRLRGGVRHGRPDRNRRARSCPCPGSTTAEASDVHAERAVRRRVRSGPGTFQYAVTQEYPLATLARSSSSSPAGSPSVWTWTWTRWTASCSPRTPRTPRLASNDRGDRRAAPVAAPGRRRDEDGELGAGCGFVECRRRARLRRTSQGAHAFCAWAADFGLGDDDALALLIAAVVHDVYHPGVDNEFLRRTESEVALQYHEDAPLERHHAYAAYALMRRPTTRFFSRWSAPRRAGPEGARWCWRRT